MQIELNELRKKLHLDKWIEKYQKEAEERNASLISENAALRRRVDQLTREKERDRRQLDRKDRQLSEAEAKQNSDKETIQSLRSELKKLLAEYERLSKENGSLREQVANSNASLKDAEEKAQEDARTIETLEKKNASLGGKIDELKAKNESKANDKNSSKPTSHIPNHKPIIVNSREKTDKQQGAQPGHPHYGRKMGLPSGGELIVCGDESPLWNDAGFLFDCYVPKVVTTVVTELHATTYFVPRFRNRETGAYINADCPPNLKDDINVSPETKAMIVYLTYMANLGVQKCQNLMKDMTHGQYAPCAGFINSLPIELAKKSSAEQAGIYAELLGVHALHVDGTNVNVGGRQYNVTILVAGDRVLYFFRPRKGYAGVKETPIEKTCAILIHDHAVEYYSYGSGHQECLEHIKRYVRRSIETEPNLTWNIQMYDFLQKLMAETKEADEKRKALQENDEESCINPDNPHARFTDEIIKEYTDEFQNILNLGIQEYEKFPAKDWFRDGKNLCERLKENPDAYLLFLHDDRVDYTNNDAERAARQIKRKQASCMEFRGFLSVIAYCESKSIIEMLKATNLPVMEALSEIFRREVTTDNEITLETEHLLVLKSALESDIEAKKRHDKKLGNLEATRKENEESLAEARKEYEAAKAKRIAECGEDSSPDDEEEAWSDKCKNLEHIIFMNDLQLKEIKQDIAFDEVHRTDLEGRIKKTEEKLARLERKKEKEKQESKAERTPAELPEVDPEILEAAIKERDEARLTLNEAFKNQLAAYSIYAKETCATISGDVYRDACGNVLVNGITDKHTEKVEKAEEEVKKAKAATDEALAVFSVAAKKLDAIKKDYRIRNRKPKDTEKKEEGGAA